MRLLNPMVVVAAVFLSGLSVGLATDSLGKTNFIIKLPFAIFLLSSEVQSASNVWIPEEPPKEVDGSVKNEYAEVSTVFAKPETKVVQSEVLPSEQAVPWTSLKQEWELYKKFHESKNKKKDDSSEDSDEEEEDEEQADEKLPIAFYGQQNADDDERDFLQREKQVRRKTKKTLKKKKVQEDSEEEDEEADDIGDPQYSGLQALDELSDEEKQAMIDRIFAEAGYTGGSVYPPSSPISASEDSEEYDDEPQDEEEEEDDTSVAPASKKVKGEEDLQDDDGGKKGKKGKGKKKKKKGKKKGGHGWGWKKPIVIPIPPPKKDEGWGWKKHDGLLEQLVKGSTWERVLAYYHHKRDEAQKDQGDEWGWGDKKLDVPATIHATSENLVDKLFKGSFWERAFQTYSQYKKNNHGKPTKEYHGGESPLQIDW